MITNSGVFSNDKKGGSGVTLIELADGVTVDEIKTNMGADYNANLDAKQSNAA